MTSNERPDTHHSEDSRDKNSADHERVESMRSDLEQGKPTPELPLEPELEASLESAATLEREVLAEASKAAAEPEPSDAKQVRRALQDLPLPQRETPSSPGSSHDSTPGVLGRDRSPRRFRPSTWAIAAMILAASLLIAWQLEWFERGSQPDSFVPLGAHRVLEEPRGSVSALTQFRWTDPRPLGPNGSYRVEILTGDHEVFTQSPPLATPVWDIPSSVVETLPAEFEWRVVIRRSAVDIDVTKTQAVKLNKTP